jgi:hypothetical protein
MAGLVEDVSRNHSGALDWEDTLHETMEFRSFKTRKK